MISGSGTQAPARRDQTVGLRSSNGESGDERGGNGGGSPEKTPAAEEARGGWC